MAGFEQCLFNFRATAEYAHVVDHPRGTLYLSIDAVEFVLQVIDLHVAIAQALEHIDDGHAHDIERLVDFVGKAGGHLAQGGHFRALRQLLLGTAHVGVVAAHRLDFEQLAVVIEHPAIGPHPPGMLAPRQLQGNFCGADRLLGSQASQALDERLALLSRQPTAQVDPRQVLGCTLQVGRQGGISEGQRQVWQVTADHGWRIFHQNAVTLLALAHLFAGQCGFGHIQP
ncbi:hypothetical protein D9M71_190410 [compost metagenome]